MVGATIKDSLTNKQHSVYAKTIINAAGPFSDEVRALSQARRVCACVAVGGGGGGSAADCH